MHLTLIYFSVIMLLSFVTGSKVQDLSDFCTQGRIHDAYLTFGIGFSDNLVAMITAQSSFNCILSFAVKAKNYIMVVLEFPDLKPKERVCVSRELSNNSVMVSCKPNTLKEFHTGGSTLRTGDAVVITTRIFVINRKLEHETLHFSDYNEKKNCQYTGSEPVYRILSLEKTSIQLTSLNDLSTIKVTATSMRGLKDFECLDVNETECTFAEQVYCMTKKIACDGNINCGVPDTYDEDISTCKGQSLTFLMKISSLLMGVLTIFLFGSICLTIMPKRKETFVYRADETVSIYDSESEIVNAEIDIQILFSEYI